jgi:hypothetical protein
MDSVPVVLSKFMYRWRSLDKDGCLMQEWPIASLYWLNLAYAALFAFGRS